MILFVTGNDIYKPDRKTNSWKKNIYNKNEIDFVTEMKNLAIPYFILYRIFDLHKTRKHNYATILILLAEVQELDICSFHGLEYIKFDIFDNTTIAMFDSEEG
jgi:hypothetical protein